MAKNKTTETETSVNDFIGSVKDERKRNDCLELIELLKKETQLEPKMWGPSIIGFGNHHYKYESGREGDSPNIAFSPRASSIAIYLSGSFLDRDELLNKFGKHKTDKGCVHIKALADIDKSILLKMIANHIKHVEELYPNK
ncbi:MAG: DUF1801 domain-containing protein [Saprospiraceae bacterium]|nr:DUF1801 domain-containing protein [Saprospiraceae bacterium]